MSSRICKKKAKSNKGQIQILHYFFLENNRKVATNTFPTKTTHLRDFFPVWFLISWPFFVFVRPKIDATADPMITQVTILSILFALFRNILAVRFYFINFNRLR
jgi:hypothetical protein